VKAKKINILWKMESDGLSSQKAKKQGEMPPPILSSIPFIEMYKLAFLST